MATRTEARNSRSDARNVHAPPGMHWCSDGHYAPVGEFVKNRSKKDGLHNRCNYHQRLYRQEYERRAGRRSDKTKTLRVDIETHSWIMVRKGKGSVAKFLRQAITFYLANVCTSSGCVGVGLRELEGRCQKCVRGSEWARDAA